MKYFKHLVLYLCLMLVPSFLFAIGMSYEDETGYTYAQGYGSYVDGAAWFSGESLGSEIHDSANAARVSSDADSTTGIATAGGTLSSESNPRTGSAGSYSLRNTASGGVMHYILEKGSGVYVTGLLFKVDYWIRGSKALTMTDRFTNGGTLTVDMGAVSVTTDWQHVTHYGLIPSTTTRWQPITGSLDADDWVEIDDLSIKPVTSLATQSLSGNLLIASDGTYNAYGYIGDAGTGLATTAHPNNITAISKADPGVVDSVAHDLSVGMQVYYSGLTEMTELNATYKTVTAVGDADHYSINDTSGYVGAETTGGACGWEVTEPDSQAVHIFKERSLTTEGWFRIETGFDYNSITSFNVYRTPGVKAQQW